VQKLADQLNKSPSLKLKDLQKFLDMIAANIDDCFDLDLFGEGGCAVVCHRRAEILTCPLSRNARARCRRHVRRAEFAKQARVEQDEEGIVRYLIEVIQKEAVEKKVIALEIIFNLITDGSGVCVDTVTFVGTYIPNSLSRFVGPTREKFLAFKMLVILISLLTQNAGEKQQAIAERLKEALAVQVLRVIRYLAENHSEW
jgi:hypothetical protein